MTEHEAGGGTGSSRVTVEQATEIILRGEMSLVGLMPNSSNYTFLARCELAGAEALAIYKPRDGESPLWDFPEGTLCLREAAAYHASELLGFSFVPPTVLRDGPHGFGSVQLFVDHDPQIHYLNMPAELDDVFRRVCAFDLVVNNADRKSGHCLLEPQTRLVWMVDHGVSFHEQPKLRTVIWDFEGEPLPADVADAVRRFAERLDAGAGPFAELLSEGEIEALALRARRLVESGVFPGPGPGRPYPWPPV